MIGIVIVSHSAKLAQGVVELARSMGGADIHIEAAGGLNLPDQPLGTDPILILSAIEEVFSDDGVLVLMDLGSALLSSEMALEMLPEEKRHKVFLCAAPIVEGAVAAAVQARIGSPIHLVAAEAAGALVPKTEHLGETAVEPQPVRPVEHPFHGVDQREIRLIINHSLGLHARPAARFVKIANRFAQSDIRIRDLTNGRGPASARSINAVMTLGVLKGHEILISASGSDAQAALDAIQALAEANFGDIEGQPAIEGILQPPTSAVPAASGSSAPLKGLPASRGFAIGPTQVFHPVLPDIPTHLINQPWEAWETLQRSIEETRSLIKVTLASAQSRVSPQTAEIFEAHLLFLEDEELLAPARSAILERKLNPVAAWHQAVEQMAARYQETTDPYLQMRANDLKDVGRQVLVQLLEMEPAAPQLEGQGILIASDLTPAETARLDPQMVLGICTAFGGMVSHTAILARSLGIPAVTGMGDQVLEIKEGTLLILDGDNGEVWINPEGRVIEEYAVRIKAAQAEKAEAATAIAQAETHLPAVTRDGHRVYVAANIASIEDTRAALLSGAEGVGLFRTEFLFMQRQSPPNEEEQVETYHAVAQALDGRPLIIRTLDIGGDKSLPYLRMASEANPFLGWRAIRFSLSNPEIFKTQLRAILRVASEYPVKVMFPMVATLAEWRAAGELLQEASGEVRNNGQIPPDHIDAGMMIEVPAAAIRAEKFAREVDFFSIGTNDLTQYTMAAERGNARLAALSDPFHPAVLELIQRVVNAAHACGKWVGVCGEMAADPLAIPLLVGLGVDELSMNAPSIPWVKRIIRTLEYDKANTQTAAALRLESPEAVRELMKAS